jgi:hypothetical protein
MNDADHTRTELLAALTDLSRIRPEWRLGQTMANLAMTAGRLESSGVWDMEDIEALAAAKMLIEQHCDVDPVHKVTAATSSASTTAPLKSAP